MITERTILIAFMGWVLAACSGLENKSEKKSTTVWLSGDSTVVDYANKDNDCDYGRDYAAQHYFMNLPAGIYKAYPDGQSDNTHFQPEGAKEIARLILRDLMNWLI